VLGPLAWYVILLGVFFTLFDNQWGLMDSTARAVVENRWFLKPSSREHDWGKGICRRSMFAERRP
jgi:hypothetical protein